MEIKWIAFGVVLVINTVFALAVAVFICKKIQLYRVVIRWSLF